MQYPALEGWVWPTSINLLRDSHQTATVLSLEGSGMTHVTNARPVTVLIHGFLDDNTLWDGVRADLEREGLTVVTPRIGWQGDMDLQSFARSARADIDAVTQEPVILVGHSMGAQVAELVARDLGDRALGLLLLAPVPLQGLDVPDEVAQALRGCGENSDAQRALRSQMTVALTAEALEHLVSVGTALPAARAAAQFDAWSNGDPQAAAGATPGIPTIVATAEDPFVTEEVLDLVKARFDSAEFITLTGAGHFPPVEIPHEVSKLVLRLVETTAEPEEPIGASAPSNVEGNVQERPWTSAFDQQSATAFAEALAEDVTLHASALLKPIHGRDAVSKTMQQASLHYAELVFTAEANSPDRTWLEWRLRTHSGLNMEGVTVIKRDSSGRITSLGIHHRPFGQLLQFSREMGELTSSFLPPGHFEGTQ